MDNAMLFNFYLEKRFQGKALLLAFQVLNKIPNKRSMSSKYKKTKL